MACLHHLVARDFRNLEHLTLDVPSPGLVLVGDNGHGKTNVLEAVYYCNVLRSLRGARDQELVRFGAPGFHVAARTDRHAIAIGFATRGKRKKVVIDHGEVQRLSDALGALPSVIFSPRDLILVTGAPSERRRYLDVMLALTSRRYLLALQAYKAALARRNAALRDTARGTNGGSARGTRAEEAVAIWEPTLAEHGQVLIEERTRWVQEFAPQLGTLCARIGERGAVVMHYTTPTGVEDLARALASRRQLDMRRGITHTGPHRDDLALSLDGRELKLYGSAGQQRTAAIALRIMEAATVRERTGDDPVLLLDDPFAELDLHRSASILELLGAGSAQTILAVPRAADIPEELTQLSRLGIRNGALI